MSNDKEKLESNLEVLEAIANVTIPGYTTYFAIHKINNKNYWLTKNKKSIEPFTHKEKIGNLCLGVLWDLAKTVVYVGTGEAIISKYL